MLSWVISKRQHLSVDKVGPHSPQHCAPQLTLVCGAEEKLVSVEEPSRCTYAAQLATPAVCTHDDHAALRRESDAAEAEAAAIRDEL